MRTSGSRRTERTLKTAPRQRPEHVKDRIVRERGFKKITTVSEELVDFDYQPTTCTRPYRVVALKKNLSVERGELVLFDEIRYFFYITNDATLSSITVNSGGSSSTKTGAPTSMRSARPRWLKACGSYERIAPHRLLQRPETLGAAHARETAL